MEDAPARLLVALATIDVVNLKYDGPFGRVDEVDRASAVSQWSVEVMHGEELSLTEGREARVASDPDEITCPRCVRSRDQDVKHGHPRRWHGRANGPSTHRQSCNAAKQRRV